MLFKRQNGEQEMLRFFFGSVAFVPKNKGEQKRDAADIVRSSFFQFLQQAVVCLIMKYLFIDLTAALGAIGIEFIGLLKVPSFITTLLPKIDQC